VNSKRAGRTASHDVAGAPSWATQVEYPDPGSVEFIRPVGSVTCGDSRDEVSVELIQRDGGPVCVLMAGMRFDADEADLLFRVVRNAVRLIPSDRSAESSSASSAVMTA
jgi:hypothetical protein